ncbi:leucine-rich repeat and calponin homology domain-containing protein 2-like isoform X7 [Crassostrea angulata]|uniref:leucine-rich repeat and calponin homology domain-containing protein 2-like isoform X7 n=1 Tax=Magallana angulata TaxID=2784310 RepID=UPI0022B180C1|nr:leucine-rich repeat and calponin homology domain-containing protein 2-like isoform X7 [Crassostrea angulata]
MANTFTGGSTVSVSRPLDRIFDDAQHTGEVILCGRKLKEYPKIAGKYDLVDTVSIDLSKNRFTEIPPEIFEYRSAECLNCYYNAIKFVPEALLQLQNLTHLCLSRNQLTVIPPFIKCLQALEVFLASHNKLVSLPEEIGELKRLMEIDVSCNEISYLPSQIGDLKSMQCLNVRRNLLIELPVELSKLHLRRLDFSGNKISVIPTAFRKIETLEDIVLDHNPLTMPPAHVCIKGKRHIMKFLQMEAIREEQKRDSEAEMKKLVRKSMPIQNAITSEEFMTDPSQDKWKRHTVLSNDSGYSTTDSLEKIGWSPNVSEALSQRQHGESSAFKSVMANGPESDLHVARRGYDARPPPINTAYSGPNTNQFSPKTPTPGYLPTELSPPPGNSSPQSPLTPVTPRIPISNSDSAFSENDITRELNRQKVEYERRKKTAEQLRIQQEEEEKEQRRKAAQRIQEEQKAMLERQWQESQANDAARAEESRGLDKKQEEPRPEVPRADPEANRGEDEARRSVQNKNPTQTPATTTTTNSTNKEEQKPSNVPLRRQGSDSRQSNPASNPPPPSSGKSVGAKTGAPGSTSRIKTPTSRGIPVLQHKLGSSVNGGNSPGISPSPSPRSSLGSTGTNSPSSSTSSLHKVGEKGTAVTRRTKPSATTPTSGRAAGGGDRGNVPPPTPVRTSSSRPSTGSSHDDNKQSRSGRSTPADDKRQGQKNAVNSLIAKRDDKKNPPHPPHRTNYGAGGARRSAGSGSAMRVIDSYKDAETNSFTLRRQEERMKEEAEQLNRLRMTIEKRLKVTLPDNLPESLRDGVLLCQFANNIRPRSVLSIHVPSPAVPKLTMAKCRKNVENFLDACRKIGVGKEFLCACDDVTEALRPARVSLTVQHLDLCPRLTPRDFAIAKLCLVVFVSTCLAVLWGYM